MDTRIAGLNTLRFLCFLWIFFGHVPHPPLQDNVVTKAYAFICSYSYIGVEIFFILSSFLLTYLAIKEKNRTGNFSIKNFLKRRALRIFPLYYLVILSCFIFLPIMASLIDSGISLPENKWLYIFFLSNFDNTDHIFALKFLWTLAISEQYYWAWALCLLIFKRSIEKVTLLFISLYFITYLCLPVFSIRAPDNPLVYLVNFATGGVMAIYYVRNKGVINLYTLLITCIVCAVIFVSVDSNIYLMKLFLCGFIGCFILLLSNICERKFVQKNWFYMLLEQLGKYSYGLYIYSGFVITITLALTARFVLNIPFFVLLFAQLLLLILIAKISYKYFEFFFVKMGHKDSVSTVSLKEKA